MASSRDGVRHFPRQKLSTAKKTNKWREQCVDAAENIGIFRDSTIRQTYRNKIINYNLANDILDTEDIERTCNPFDIEGAKFPAKMQNYPIALPKIDLLVGEEAKRKFDWRVRVLNQDAISEKENEIKKMYFQAMAELIQAESFDEQQAQEKLQKLQKFVKYEYQDMRERMGTQILKHLWKEQELALKFNRGFYDALVAGEEIYACDIIAGEPVVERWSPLNVHTIRSGESPYIEDSDLIIHDGYHSPGQVIDRYYEYLSDEDIRKIEEGHTEANSSDNFINIGEREQSIVIDGLIDIVQDEVGQFGGPFDADGNIRVMRVLWKSLRKVGRLKYYDEEGQEQEEIVPEQYKPNKDLGEEVEWFWISEWWEGTKIGGGDYGGIYVKMQPRPVQFRNMTNLSKCHPGVVGTAYNINTSKSLSLLDRMKPYQYLYNVLMYRTELAFAKSHGKIMRLPLHEVPEGWDMDKWLSYAYTMNLAVYDAFKEGNKGAATGKLAGQMQQNNQVIDLEMGNYIQQHINMMEYIKKQMGEIAGVSEARQGQIATREAVGNVEREVTQSSHITEKWFMAHDNVKLRVMSCLLETAKHAWRNTSRKVQHVLDDMSTNIINIDGEQFNEIDYGLAISNSANDAELLQSMKQLAHAGIQNDKISFSQLLDIYMSDSLSDIRRKIETAEEEKNQRDQQQMQMQQQMQQEQLQAQQQQLQAQQDFEAIKLDTEVQMNREDNETKLTIAQMQIEGAIAQKSMDFEGREGETPEDNTAELEKIRQQQQKIDNDYKLKQQQLSEQARANKVSEKQKQEEIAIKRKQANKPTTTSK